MRLLLLATNLILVFPVHAQNLGSTEPDKLTQLRASWQHARQKATDPIDQKYRQELERMMAALTKAGDLNGAIAVRTELETLIPSKATPPPPVASPEKELPGKRLTPSERRLIESWIVKKTWLITYPNGSGETIYFAEDGKAARKSGDKIDTFNPEAGWTIEDDGTIVVGYGYRKYIRLTGSQAGTAKIVRKDDHLDCTVAVTADIPELIELLK